MTLRSWLALAALTLPAIAAASPASVASQLAQMLSGVTQVCPDTYKQGSCVRVNGDAVTVADKIFKSYPALLPNVWRDGPEGGLSSDIELGDTTLSVIPRGENQSLLLLQPRAVAAPSSPALATAGPSTPPTFTIENPTGNYFVILDGDQPVRDPFALKPGTYQMIVSATGKITQRVSLTVPTSGLTRLSVPTLSVTSYRADRASLQLPVAPGYVFIVFTGGGKPVLDLAELLPGYYDVRSYLNGEVGPVAFLQELQLGAINTLKFQGTFMTGAAASTVTTPASLVTPTATPASSNSGQCYVNGYRRSNGTYVSGYWRRC